MEVTRDDELKAREFWDWSEMFQEWGERGFYRWLGSRELQSTLKGHVSK